MLQLHTAPGTEQKVEREAVERARGGPKRQVLPPSGGAPRVGQHDTQIAKQQSGEILGLDEPARPNLLNVLASFTPTWRRPSLRRSFFFFFRVSCL